MSQGRMVRQRVLLLVLATLFDGARSAVDGRRIACVGDEFGGDYASALESLLGSGAVVKDLSVEGATAGPKAPWTGSAGALDAAGRFQPDVAFVLLGHNDASDFKGTGNRIADTFALGIKVADFHPVYRDQLSALLRSAPTLTALYVASPRGSIKDLLRRESRGGVPRGGLATMAEIVIEFVDELRRANVFPDIDLVPVDLAALWADATTCGASPNSPACAAYYASFPRPSQTTTALRGTPLRV